MARQIRNESCRGHVEKRNITSKTSLFGIVKNVLKLNHSRSTENILSYGTAGNSEAIDSQARIQAAEAQLRRMQMIR